MGTTYEVWDTGAANQMGAFQTEAEAKALLHDVLRVNGPDVAREMAILAYSRNAAGEYEPRTVLEGVDFVARLEPTENTGRAAVGSEPRVTTGAAEMRKAPRNRVRVQ